MGRKKRDYEWAIAYLSPKETHSDLAHISLAR